LFGVRAWRSRDEMYRRMQVSTLFVSDLAPPYNAARLFWSKPAREAVDWVSGVIAASADDIQAALRPELRAYLLIVNTSAECVVGARRAAVLKLAEAAGKPMTLLTGVTLAHCEVGRAVEVPYRELHTLPVSPTRGLTIYSGAWGKSYKPSDRKCAESITTGLVGTIDVPAVGKSADRDGVGGLFGGGPGNSRGRAIDAIRSECPPVARAAHAARQDAVSQILRLVAHLAAERVPVDLATLYGRDSRCVAHRERAKSSANEVIVPVGRRVEQRRDLTP